MLLGLRGDDRPHAPFFKTVAGRLTPRDRAAAYRALCVPTTAPASIRIPTKPRSDQRLGELLVL
jgi:hypothetical protein